MLVQNNIILPMRADLTKDNIAVIKKSIQPSLKEVPGLVLRKKNWMVGLLGDAFPQSLGGIVVAANKNGELNVGLYFFVIFGYNIREVSLKAQEIVKRDLLKNLKYPINHISAYILGFDKGAI